MRVHKTSSIIFTSNTLYNQNMFDGDVQEYIPTDVTQQKVSVDCRFFGPTSLLFSLV